MFIPQHLIEHYWHNLNTPRVRTTFCKTPHCTHYHSSQGSASSSSFKPHGWVEQTRVPPRGQRRKHSLCFICKTKLVEVKFKHTYICYYLFSKQRIVFRLLFFISKSFTWKCSSLWFSHNGKKKNLDMVTTTGAWLTN